MEKDFTELINTNRALIYKVCHLYCHDAEQRKDLFQEIVLQLWKSFPHFKKQSAPGTWLYRIALNTAISNFRKQTKIPESRSLNFSEFEIPDLYAEGEEKENRNALHLAIDKLSEIEKAIILLYLDDKSYDEISEIIGISNSNVGVRLNRIKNKLSKLVKTGYDH